MGKMLKRLDNHLNKFHRGVTRGLNDNQPKRRVLEKSGKSRVTCLLPGCFKEVIHLSCHIRNVHSISLSDYCSMLGIKEREKKAGKEREKEAAKGIEKEAAKGIEKEAAKGIEKKAGKEREKKAAKGIEKGAAKGIEKEAAKGIEKKAAKEIEKKPGKEREKKAAKGIEKGAAKGREKKAAMGREKKGGNRIHSIDKTGDIHEHVEQHILFLEKNEEYNYVSEDVLAEESETSELAISHGEQSSDVSMSESVAIPQDSFDLDAELHSNEYNDEHLRFLEHNTSADGIYGSCWLPSKDRNTVWHNSRSQEFAK